MRLMRKKKVMKAQVLWLVALLLLSSTTFASERVKGNGNVITRNIVVDDFDQMRLGSRIEYSHRSDGWNFFRKNEKRFPKCIYTQTMGNASLEITIDENLFEWLDVAVIEGELRIQAKGDYRLSPSQLIIRVTSNSLKSVDITGSMDFVSNTLLCSDELRINLSGYGSIKMEELACGTLYCDISGNGSAHLKGKADMAVYQLSGMGTINAVDCAVDNLKCDISGLGKMEVNAVRHLHASTSGVGSIRYKGDVIANTNIAGLGRIKKMD